MILEGAVVFPAIFMLGFEKYNMLPKPGVKLHLFNFWLLSFELYLSLVICLAVFP